MSKIALKGIPDGSATITIEPPNSIVNRTLTLPDSDGELLTTGVLGLSNGSNSVGFLQSGAGAEARTVQDKLRDVVSVKDFGAVGDGVTDDTAAIQSAITAAYGKTLHFHDGNYVVSSSLVVLDNISIKMSSNAIIDGRSIPAATVAGQSDILKASGSKGSAILLSANTFTGNSTYTLASALGLSVGDYILIRSNAYHSPGVTTGFNYQGWITQIKSIAGNVITTHDKAYDDMLVAEAAKVEKLNLIQFNMEGGKILGSGVGYSNGGLRLTYCKNSTVSNVTIEDTEDIGVSIEYSTNVLVSGMEISNCTSGSLKTTGYGVVFVHATAHCKLENSRITNCRHSVSGGGNYPARHITIDSNITVGCGLSSNDLDCHEPCYYWNIINNSITPSADTNGGIQIRGKNILVQGNKIYGGNLTGYGILVNSYITDTSGQTDIRIIGNTIYRTMYGIRLGVAEYATALNKITITDNHIIDFASYAIKNEQDISEVNISNNIIRTFSTGLGLALSKYTSSGKVVVSGNNIRVAAYVCVLASGIGSFNIVNNIFVNSGGANCLEITGGFNISIISNKYSGEGTFALLLSPSSDQTSVSILGNSASIVAAGTEDFARISGVGKRVNVSNNICAGTFRYGCWTSDRDKVIISHNIFEGNTSAAVATNATTSIVEHNIES